MRDRTFTAFRKLARLVSGHGLRDRFELVDQIYKSLNRGLAPSVAHVHEHVMHLDRDDSMGLAVAGEYEPTETRLIFDLIQPGYVVLDIGANIGYYSLIFAGLVGPTGHVYSFEPDPYSFDLLSQNVAANHYANVSPFQVAVFYKDTELWLDRDRFNNLDHRIASVSASAESVPVKAVKLDSFLPELMDLGINFIKMDIQGAEGWALEGMRDLIRNSRSIEILTEFWPSGLDQTGYGGAKYLERLSSLGFELFDVREDENGLTPAGVDELARRYSDGIEGHTNLLCRR